MGHNFKRKLSSLKRYKFPVSIYIITKTKQVKTTHKPEHLKYIVITKYIIIIRQRLLFYVKKKFKSIKLQC